MDHFGKFGRMSLSVLFYKETFNSFCSWRFYFWVRDAATWMVILWNTLIWSMLFGKVVHIAYLLFSWVFLNVVSVVLSGGWEKGGIVERVILWPGGISFQCTQSTYWLQGLSSRDAETLVIDAWNIGYWISGKEKWAKSVQSRLFLRG